MAGGGDLPELGSTCRDRPRTVSQLLKGCPPTTVSKGLTDVVADSGCDTRSTPVGSGKISHVRATKQAVLCRDVVAAVQLAESSLAFVIED